MKFPTFFGIRQMADLIVKKYNQDLLDIRQWWDEHDSGSRTWTNVTGATVNGTTNLQFNGNNVGSNAIFTPSVVGGGTITNNLGFYQLLGNMVHVWGSFKTGTTTGVTATLAVPVGTLVYTNRNVTDGSTFIGWLTALSGSAAFISAGRLFPVVTNGVATDKVFFAQSTPTAGTAAWPTSNGNVVFDANSYHAFDFWYALA